jgi:hypothetical protein
LKVKKIYGIVLGRSTPCLFWGKLSHFAVKGKNAAEQDAKSFLANTGGNNQAYKSFVTENILPDRSNG